MNEFFRIILVDEDITYQV